MSFTGDLLDGIAADLAELGVGHYVPDDVGGSIVLGALPDEVTQGAGVTDYGLQADPDASDVTQPVQVTLRGDSGWVRETADAIFDRWHGATNLTLGDLPLSLVWLNSDANLGVDDEARQLRALNYYFTGNRPTASRPD